MVVEYPPAPIGPLWMPPFLEEPTQALAEGCLGVDPIPTDDTLWFASWHLEQAASAIDMDAVQGWNVCAGEDPGEGSEDEVAKLYLLDTGIQVDHPDLDLKDLVLPVDAPLAVESVPDLMGGVAVLRAERFWPDHREQYSC